MSELKPHYIIVNRLIDGRVRFAIAGDIEIMVSGEDAVKIARSLVMVATDQSLHSEFWVNVPDQIDDNGDQAVAEQLRPVGYAIAYTDEAADSPGDRFGFLF